MRPLLRDGPWQQAICFLTEARRNRLRPVPVDAQIKMRLDKWVLCVSAFDPIQSTALVNLQTMRGRARRDVAKALLPPMDRGDERTATCRE